MKQVHPTGRTDQAAQIWALTSYRAGETSQILALAEALAEAMQLNWQRVDVDYQPWAGPVGLLRLQTRVGTASGFSGPWPQLLISAGLRNEPISRWLRNASGGRTRLIFLGRTWASARHFDLVVATPQYRLSPAANVLENPLTLHQVTPAALQQARAAFSSRYGAAADRKVGVLLGGDSGPYRFDAAYARQLAMELNDFAAGGDIRYLISSSSRTPEQFLAALASQLHGQHDIHDWRSPGANPYRGILAWSDTLVVTADSIAMISEAVATGKRVLLSEPSVAGSIGSRIYNSAISWGHKRWTRDVSLVHLRLLKLGLVGWLGEAGSDDLICQSLPDDYGNKTAYLQSTVAHIQRQFG